jgi:hypothetical protein
MQPAAARGGGAGASAGGSRDEDDATSGGDVVAAAAAAAEEEEAARFEELERRDASTARYAAAAEVATAAQFDELSRQFFEHYGTEGHDEHLRPLRAEDVRYFRRGLELAVRETVAGASSRVARRAGSVGRQSAEGDVMRRLTMVWACGGERRECRAGSSERGARGAA